MAEKNDTMVSVRKYTSRFSKAMRMCGPSTGGRFGRNKLRGMNISAPSNFRRETTCIPGLSNDELVSLRELAYEKALASQIGIMDFDSIPPRRLPPAIPARPMGGPMSSNPVIIIGGEGPKEKKKPGMFTGKY
ncbi:hypothetical protein MCOR27_002900 [Pyricularia oryzae]|uniref:Uncharacterized protein n=2 Tax=Pyricularia TaxID=48558 RepID=A0ABQ8NU52_PYRGI|nr:hypothetical protein MCOR01_000491 [Pyricularia oryzae]KAI6301937.1 hypothetical protein MCOR33_002659 [Pyricularia grisea]KAH9428763.1 hypothetical protein MCOR02_011309 [Pyricularia oryzae]KAI6255663.1 hypothetical protein MCOR19_007866 [Pyricularia oryzae]KAI6268362.1 hypothetical protein MCOR26_009251 [Pyricularia oryzae]